MGRHQENPAHQYFSYDGRSRKSFCKIEGCGALLTGNHGGNLQRHLERRHPAKYVETFIRKRPAPVDRNSTMHKIKKPKIVRVHISPDVLKEACVELVTVNGRPFSLMDDSGFRKMIDPIQEAMNDFSINSSNIGDMVSVVARKKREELKNELHGRLLMLKIDVATYKKQTVLSVNAQYTKGDTIVLSTLAVKPLFEGHTAEYISSVVKDVLQEYNVQSKQVYSVTLDNGDNMIKSSLVSDMQGDVLLKDENEADAEDTGEEEDESVDVKVENQELVIEFDSGIQGHVLHSVRCSAQVLHLAVDDALSERRLSNLISKARMVAQTLRSQKAVAHLKIMGHKRAIVDTASRWHTTHNMLERLLELRDFCEEMSKTIKDLHLSKNEWQDILSIVCALKPAKIASKRLQTDQLTAGDFYGVWLQCVLCTSKIDSSFAKRLVQCLKSHQTTLFDSDAFVAALFLDPRYRLFLTEHQTERAKVHLYGAWEMIQNLCGDYAPYTPSKSSDEDEDEIEQLLIAKEKEIATARNSHVSISHRLDTYSREARLKRSECVFKYWASIAPTNPDLNELAMNVIAFPVTQVSVERVFSCLRFMLSPLRSSMNANVLEDVLFLRLNTVDFKLG